MNFHINMNFKDIALRYAIVMVLTITGGLMHSLPLMILAIPFFLTAMLGWCPLYSLLGIHHDMDRHHC